MSSIYKIHRWDVIENPNQPSTVRSSTVPALYVLPDKQLMEHIRESNFKIPIKITGSNSIYDNKLAMATCQPSQTTAGFRPNFQDQTGYIVVAPDTRWEGYPNDMGEIHVLAESSADKNSDDDVSELFDRYVAKPIKQQNPLFFVAVILILALIVDFIKN